MKALLTAGTLQSLWGEYRDDVCDLVVGRVADMCVEHTGGVAEGAQALLTRTEQVMDGFPRLVKRVL